MKRCPVLIVLALAGCSNHPDDTLPITAAAPASAATSAPAAAPTAPTDPRSRIDPNVFESYPETDYPKLRKLIGNSWSRVQPFREAAAFKALENPKCQHVDVADISLARSSADNLAIFVYCNNASVRFDFTERDISTGAPRTNADRAISRSTAIMACSDAAKSLAAFPSLVDTHIWAGASYNVAANGAARVLLDFEATNALGHELPYRANCLFPLHGSPEITVNPR